MSQKTRKIMIIILSTILFIAIGGYIAWNMYFTDARMLKEHWNIVLPDNIEKQYDISSFGALGDGSSYTIYKLSGDSLFQDKMSSERNITMQDNVIDILKKLKVDKLHYPDFSHAYKWKVISMESDTRNKLYVICDTKMSLIYLIQDFY